MSATRDEQWARTIGTIDEELARLEQTVQDLRDDAAARAARAALDDRLDRREERLGRPVLTLIQGGAS